ncbi:hypothetical protein MSG28_006459 [Choristoneura fumiferana]|uniref:Uncharacterized protein n=1 Tax=Choristoneura fumiferana TaxID=7141 RepID=A0ACC0JF00_CHOFU|nr:hypothetical protein MSG28_006459 [Choristoneura fumiferana]
MSSAAAAWKNRRRRRRGGAAHMSSPATDVASPTPLQRTYYLTEVRYHNTDIREDICERKVQKQIEDSIRVDDEDGGDVIRGLEPQSVGVTVVLPPTRRGAGQSLCRSRGGKMERPIAYHLLRREELQYEVEIRDAKAKDTVEELRGQIRELSSAIPADEVAETSRTASSELDAVESKLDEVLRSLRSGPQFKSFVRLRAIAHHCYHRLGRVEESADLSSRREALEVKMTDCLSRVDALFRSFKSSFEASPDPCTAAPEIAPASVIYQVSCSGDKSVARLNHLFDGTTCVRAYLQRLEELCHSRGIPHHALFLSAVELFSGSALTWYRGVKTALVDWSDLKAKLIQEFLPLDFDDRLLAEIRNRTQGAHESALNFVSVLLNYFSRLTRDVSEEEKLRIIRTNLRPQYLAALALEPVDSISDLKRKCKLLEHSFAQVSAFHEPSRASDHTVAPDLAYRSRSSGHVEVVQLAEAAGTGTSLFCVRCRVHGHSVRTCASKAIVCYHCGTKDVTSSTCPNCKKGSPTVSKN